MAILSHPGRIGEGPSTSTSRNACGERFDGMSPSSEVNSARAGTKRSRIHLTRSAESAGEGDPISSRSEEHIAVRIPICKKRRMTARSYRALLTPNRRRAGNLGSEHEGIEADCLQGADLQLPKPIKSTPKNTTSLHLQHQLQSLCSTCSILPRVNGASQLGIFCSCNANVGETEEGSFDTEDETWSGGKYHSLFHMYNSSKAIQRSDSHTVCIVCNQTGSLLCCGRKGCNSAYHLACLDPPLNETPLGQWLCFCCLRKKIVFGVYSVSEGVESIWDSREEMQEMYYLVKYKGLAHAHNRWIPESRLIHEDSMLLAKFKKHQKEQVKKWNQEWMQPHRLLKKRVLIPPERTNECSCGYGDNYDYCYIEWFVKWKGLGYEHATWEFENSPFLCSAEGKTLIDDYERCHERAKKASDLSRTVKAEYIKKKPFDNLSRLLDGCLSELDSSHLESVRRILKRWHGNQNAVIVDDQEKIIKSIMFLLSLMPYACRPFLVISKISCLSTWEAEFVHLAPSISIVVYSGSRSVRKMIQSFEFYEEGGCIMFQVLLASPNDVVEDLEAFDCIGWEVVIIDECQNSGVSKHLGKLSDLAAAFRLILLNSLPKDNIVDYLNILSFLDPSGQEGPVDLKLDAVDSNDEFSILRERLRQYLVEENTQNSSPVCLSTDVGELNSIDNQLHEPGSRGAEAHMRSGNSEMVDDHDIELGELKEHSFCASRKEDPCMKKVERTARNENQSDFPKDLAAGSKNSLLPCLQDIVEESLTSIQRNGVPQEFLQERSAEVTDNQEWERGGNQCCALSNDVAEYLKSNVSSQKGEIRYDSYLPGCPEKPNREQIQSLNDETLKERIESVNQICSARLDALLLKQSQEVSEFKTQIDGQKQCLLRSHSLGLEKIRASNIDFEVGNDMKKLQYEFVKEMDRFNQHIKCQRKKLAVMQILARNKQKKINYQWLEQAKLGSLVESVDMLPMSVTGFKLEKFNFREQIEDYDKSLNSGSSLDATKSAGSIELGIPSRYHSNLAEDESPASQSRSVNALEPAEPCITLNTMKLAGLIEPNISDSGGVIIPNDAMKMMSPGLAIGSTEDILAEEESPDCQSISENALEPAEPSRTSLDIVEPVQCERINDNLMETEALVSQHEIMKVSGDHDGFDNIPGTSAQHSECAELDAACLTSTLPSQTGVASFSQSSDCTGSKNSALHDQDSLVVEIENQVVPGNEKEPNCSHPHDVVIPVSNGDTELTLLEHCNQIHESTDDHVLQQLPPTDLTLDVPSNERAEVQAERGGQPSNRSHCVVQLDGVSRSAPTVATSAKIWPANNSFSDSVIPPVIGISNVAARNIQNHHHRSSNVQPETNNSPSVLSAVQQHMHEEGPDSDPLLLEMIGLRKEEHSLTQDCEKKKLELQVECDKELEKVRNKYASMIQDMETEYTQKLKVNKKRQSLVQMNHNLAENFRGYFFENKRRTSAISQGEPSSSAHELNQSPRPEIAQTLCWASPSTPGPSPLYYPRGLHNSSSIATPPPTRPIYSSVVFSNDSVRHHPTYQSNVNPLARMEPRAPAPHLRPFR